VKDGVLPLLKGFEHSVIKVTTNKMLERPIECRMIRHMLRHRLTGLSKHTAEELCDGEEGDLAFLAPYINKPNVIDSLLTNSKRWNVYSLNHLFLNLFESENLTNHMNAFVTEWKELLKQTNHEPKYYVEKTIDLMVSSKMSDLYMEP
jgi:GTPase SAR1 family protein